MKCKIWMPSNPLHGLTVNRPHTPPDKVRDVVVVSLETRGDYRVGSQLIFPKWQVVPLSCGRMKAIKTCPCFECRTNT